MKKLKYLPLIFFIVANIGNAKEKKYHNVAKIGNSIRQSTGLYCGSIFDKEICIKVTFLIRLKCIFQSWLIRDFI